MFDFVAIGESLIDFTPSGKNELDLPMYSQNPGGAPANVLAMTARLGAKTAFIGKVGKDAFGMFLKKNMEEAGIDCSSVILDEKYNTTLAFVSLDCKGDRSFSFYRDPGADVMLSYEEVKLPVSKVFHFGSVSMTADPTRTATIETMKKAKEFGSIISYDPNYRPLLWSDEQTAIITMKSVIPFCDIIKVSDEELKLLSGTSDLNEGSRILSEQGALLVVVTLGAKGAFVRFKDYTESFKTFDVKTIDTTGAGDSFWGAFLWKLVIDYDALDVKAISSLSIDKIMEAMIFANAAGSLTTTGKGAIPAMPDKKDILDCIENTPLL